jgi:hypothetical protein
MFVHRHVSLFACVRHTILNYVPLRSLCHISFTRSLCHISFTRSLCHISFTRSLCHISFTCVSHILTLVRFLVNSLHHGLVLQVSTYSTYTSMNSNILISMYVLVCVRACIFINMRNSCMFESSEVPSFEAVNDALSATKASLLRYNTSTCTCTRTRTYTFQLVCVCVCPRAHAYIYPSAMLLKLGTCTRIWIFSFVMHVHGQAAQQEPESCFV